MSGTARRPSRCRALVPVRRRRSSSLPAALRPPVMGICRNPMRGVMPHDMIEVPAGVPLRDFVIESAGPPICHYNGEWLLREHWGETTKPGDVIVWIDSHDLPQSKTSLIETVLGYALIAAGIFTLNPELAAFGVKLAAIGVISGIFSLFAPRAPKTPQTAAANGVFTTSLSGNVATLDTPIWKNMGRVKITPNFAGQPYGQFRASDPLNPTVDCDQYYFAILIVGIGNHEIEKTFIGMTPIEHFSDVLVAQYLPPGTQPSQAQGNVVTSEDVSAGLELDSDQYVGPYTESRPGDAAVKIEIDVGASQGLGTATGDPITVRWQVERRQIDNFGRPLSDFSVLGIEEREAYTNTPQRWTTSYTVPAVRGETRVVRVNTKSTDANVRDGIQWIGMRAFLQRPAPLDPNAAHFEIVMRASQQLSAQTQNDVSMIVRALVRTWSPGGGWAAESFSRNPAWWLADLWTNAVWGEGLPDSRVDLAGLYAWAQTLDARQDHIGYTAATTGDAWDLAQLIARTGRAHAFRAAGAVRTVARDELVDLPVTAITPRIAQPKSMILHAATPQREEPDSIVAQWLSDVTWDTASQECPGPGFSVSDPDDPRFDPDLPPMANPVFRMYDGITGATHAEREGLFDAYDQAIRKTTVESVVGDEAVLLRYFDLIRWQPQIRGYGQAGDVAFWNPSTLVMGLTEPPDWSQAPLYLTLHRDDGSLTTPALVTPGPTANDVVLPAIPDFDLVLDDGLRERPKFILGPVGGDEMAKVVSITDGGKSAPPAGQSDGGGAQLYKILALIDDDRVHLADNHLLPGPGDIQDPIDDGTDDPVDTGGGTAALVRTTVETVGSTSGGKYQISFNSDGSLTFEYFTDPGHVVSSSGTYANAWLNQVVEPATAGLFECFGTLYPTPFIGTVTGAAMGTWANLGSGQTIVIDASSAGPDMLMQFELGVAIRRVGTTVTQGTEILEVSFGVIEGG